MIGTGIAVRNSTRSGELVRLHGEHDLSTAAAVGALIRQAAQARPRMLVVDLTSARFIDLAIGHELRRAAREFAEIPFAIAYDPDSQARAVIETLFPQSNALDDATPWRRLATASGCASNR